jgi:hypothetical protein
MHQFEVSLSSDDAACFDAIFWDYLSNQVDGAAELDVKHEAYACGPAHRRRVAFSGRAEFTDFLNLWRAAAQGPVRA